MRVVFGDTIVLCTSFSHRKGSTLIIVSNASRRWDIRCKDAEEAERLYLKMLFDGYIDASDLSYSRAS